ncbi:MAG: hydrogenase maturation nickel metallochaperone HypA [Lachnospiraceae bacterium]|nr:hydrogenase maturation nickel metallochaperone HypA [Lachnospiraceae bacterium]
MHELGVTFHIMDHLERVAEENQAVKICKVTLELGEVSTVIESYLQNCWKWAAAKRPLFEEAELVVETLPAITFCEECDQTYATVEHGKICPYCGSGSTYLLQGNEFNIKEIEVE